MADSGEYQKHFKAVAIYGLDEKLCGMPFEVFVERYKNNFMVQLAEMAGFKQFTAQFYIEKLDFVEKLKMADKFQSSDLQRVFNGEFISPERLEKIVEKECRKLILEGYITVPVIDGKEVQDEEIC